MADATSNPANAGNDLVAPPANPAPTALPDEMPVLVAARAHDDVPGPVAARAHDDVPGPGAAPTQGDVPGPVIAPGFPPPAEVDIAGIWVPAPSQSDYLFIVNLPVLSR